jgi:hypothetical protein
LNHRGSFLQSDFAPVFVWTSAGYVLVLFISRPSKEMIYITLFIIKFDNSINYVF